MMNTKEGIGRGLTNFKSSTPLLPTRSNYRNDPSDFHIGPYNDSTERIEWLQKLLGMRKSITFFLHPALFSTSCPFLQTSFRSSKLCAIRRVSSRLQMAPQNRRRKITRTPSHFTDPAARLLWLLMSNRN